MDENFNQNEIYFTRVNIGNINPGNKINILVVEYVKPINYKNVISVKMFGTPNTLTSTIKKIYYLNLFIGKLPKNEMDVEINKLTKELKKKTDVKIYRYNNQLTLYLDEVEMEFV